MQLFQTGLPETHSFSPTFLEYLSENPHLRHFYESPPKLESFEKHIQLRNKFPKDSRIALHKVLKQRYANANEIRQKQIDSLLDENTFTVTTGHQLALFTGPLYFIYKILSTIDLAKRLKAQYTDYHFVPVFWMASEDHDFEEINHFNLFGQTYTWESNQKGAVGRFHTGELETLINEISPKIEPYTVLFRKAYLEHPTLSEATQYLVDQWFGGQGLLCVDADHAEFKKQLVPLIKDDLSNGQAFLQVNIRSKQLEEQGFQTQISPREINFFYLQEGLRERIIQEEGCFKVLNTDISFKKEEIEKEIEQHPERFSPNVVLRPLYQEIILPNLAYIGGPAEVVYWLQLKSTFDHYQAPYPVLLPRNFAMIINKATQKKIEKLGLPLENLFDDELALKQWLLSKTSQLVLDFTEERKSLDNMFEQYTQKSSLVDKSLEGWLAAEKQKISKSLEMIENRLKKTEEKKSETEISQLMAMKNKLFPNKGLQERSDNILNFLINQPGLIDEILNQIHVFDFKMNIFVETE